MTRRFALTLGVLLALLGAACAKSDEPRAPAPPASKVSSAVTPDDGGVEVDAAGALRALPMPQAFPRVVWDAAAADASRDAARR